MKSKDARMEFWDREYKKETSETTETISARKAVDVFRKNNASKILDAGCGIGQDSRYLHKNGLNVRGIDFSKTAIEKARSSVKEVGFECTGILEADIPKGSLDGVYCSKVLHQFRKAEIEKDVKMFYGWLKSGGVLVATVLSDRDVNFGAGEEVEERTFLKEDGRVIHYFSIPEIRELLERHGFVGIETEYIEEFGRITRKDIRHTFMFSSAKKK